MAYTTDSNGNIVLSGDIEAADYNALVSFYQTNLSGFTFSNTVSSGDIIDASNWSTLMSAINTAAGTSYSVALPTGTIGVGKDIQSISTWGKPVQLRPSMTSFNLGINISGAETSGAVGADAASMFPTATMVEYYASKGIKCARIPGLMENFFPTFGDTTLRTTYVTLFTNMLDLLKDNGIYVLLEPFHNYGYAWDGTTSKEVKFGDGTFTSTIFADCWTALLTELLPDYADMFIGYDLMNEPHDIVGAENTVASQSATWVEYAQAAITAIRKLDTTTPIVVEGYQYSSAYNWPAYNPTLNTLTDPNNNLVFSAHSYLDRDSSGTYFLWDEEVTAGSSVPSGAMTTEIGTTRLEPFVEWCKDNNFIGHLGETGAGHMNSMTDSSATNWNAALKNEIDYMKSNNFGVMYWAGGADFHSSFTDSESNVYSYYPYCIDEISGVEAPQWTTLSDYLTAPSS